MPTETEELQAKEFLKRAEIRTMKKDLLALREGDALQERDKIAKIRTLEEQLAEKKRADTAATIAVTEKTAREEVLQKNEGQERTAEKDLKNFATEEERQQIFLLESQRFEFEKQVDAIDKEKGPALKLKKNQLLLQQRDLETKLNAILEQEKKLEGEQKVIIEKQQTTTVPAERKTLEESRWELDKKIQDVEKKRWESEKQIQDINTQTSQIDKSSDQLVTEKNGLRDKILGVDKSLRDIYSGVMAREEEKRRGSAQEEVARQAALSKMKAEQNEQVQRQQWTGTRPSLPKESAQIPIPTKKIPTKSFEAEEEQREKFLQDVELGSNKNQGQPQQKSNI